MVVACAPLILGGVHGVEDVKTDSVQVGELVTQEVLLVECEEFVVISCTLCTCLAFPRLCPVVVRICLKTVTDSSVQGKEGLGVLGHVAGVVQGGGVAGGAEPLSPESSITHNIIKSSLDDFNLVLAGQEILAVYTFCLAVLKCVEVGPNIDEVMHTVPAHVNRLGILGGTFCEGRAAVAELLQHHLALVLGRHG